MIVAYLAMTGLIVGSFLNVCIFRLPKEESVVFPGSHCRSCRQPIAWYDNVPVLSFVLLKGRCRHCKTEISRQYAVIEILTAGLFIFFYRRFGLTPLGVTYLALTLALVVETMIDFRHQIIPDEITLPGMAIGLILSAIYPAFHGQVKHLQGFIQSFIGLLAGGGFFYFSAVIAEKLLKKEALGGGDVKLMAMLGSFFGWQGVFWTIFVSSVAGSVIGIYLRLRKGVEAIPYGPYIALGAVLYMIWGQGVTRAYFDFLNTGY